MNQTFTKQLLLLMLCFCSAGMQANTYTVSSQAELNAAISDANATPSSNSNPHVINLCTGGQYYLPTILEPLVLNAPADHSARFNGYYFNFGQSLNGKHFVFNNLTFFNQLGSAFGSAWMSSNGGGTSILNNCRFSTSSALYQAGGVFNNFDSVYLYGCTFDGNFTTDIGGEGGAAAFNNGGFMSIVNCTFSGNYSISTSATGGGGAVKNHQNGKMVVRNSTFYNNGSASRGGAISTQGGNFCDISNCIFVGNSAAISGNNVFGNFTSTYGHNIFTDTVGATIGGVTTGNVYGAAASSVINTTLSDNGHYTFTHALVANSPAIDAADASAAPATDQRDYTRSNTADIGSHEYNGVNPCAGFSISINTPAVACQAQLNNLSYVITGGTAPTTGNWFVQGENEWICGAALSYFGNYTFVATAFDSEECVAKDTIVINNSAPVINKNFTICYGDTVTYNDSIYTQAGNYTINYNCDSIIQIAVSLFAAPVTYSYYSICPDSTVSINGIVYNSSGYYTQYFGCDSTVEILISDVNVPVRNNNVVICYGESYTVGANTYTQSGNYTNYFGCDSVVNTALTVQPQISLPTISSTTLLCNNATNGTITLTANTAIDFTIGGNSYSFGGDTVWADTVIAFSTEYNTSPGNWSAYQLLGEPNTYPDYGDIVTAWTSDDYGNQREFLVVGYTIPVTASQLLIYETNAPGYIDTVYVREYPSGNWTTVYTGTAAAGPEVATIFAVNLPSVMTVDQVRWAIANDIATDWVEYDAVGLVKPSADSVTITANAGAVLPISVSQGGCTVSGNINVPNPPAIPLTLNVSMDTICAGESITLIANGAASYAWSTGATTSTITASPSSTTMYIVTATNNVGCTAVSSSMIVVELCIGLEEIANTQMSIYPNPTGGVLYIESRDEIASIKVFDMHGRTVAEVNTLSTGKMQLNVGNFSEGVYTIQLKTSSGNVASERFLKQ